MHVSKGGHRSSSDFPQNGKHFEHFSPIATLVPWLTCRFGPNPLVFYPVFRLQQDEADDCRNVRRDASSKGGFFSDDRDNEKHRGMAEGHRVDPRTKLTCKHTKTSVLCPLTRCSRANGVLCPVQFSAPCCSLAIGDMDGRRLQVEHFNRCDFRKPRTGW